MSQHKGEEQVVIHHNNTWIFCWNSLDAQNVHSRGHVRFAGNSGKLSERGCRVAHGRPSWCSTSLLKARRLLALTEPPSLLVPGMDLHLYMAKTTLLGILCGFTIFIKQDHLFRGKDKLCWTLVKSKEHKAWGQTVSSDSNWSQYLVLVMVLEC